MVPKKVTFKEKVFSVVRAIPAGKVLTYRQVGNILTTNYDSAIPCHRVIRSDGAPGGYNRGTSAKIKKLRGEGYDI